MSRHWLIPYAVGIVLVLAIVIVGNVANWSGEAQGVALMGVILIGVLIQSALEDGVGAHRSPPSEPG